MRENQINPEKSSSALGFGKQGSGSLDRKEVGISNFRPLLITPRRYRNPILRMQSRCRRRRVVRRSPQRALHQAEIA